MVVLCGTGLILTAQNLHLVWADEFEGTALDPSVWQFEYGPSNDNVQFYTDRAENVTLADGKLRIMALKESYQGYDFTSAHIRTEPDHCGCDQHVEFCTDRAKNNLTRCNLGMV